MTSASGATMSPPVGGGLTGEVIIGQTVGAGACGGNEDRRVTG